MSTAGNVIAGLTKEQRKQYDANSKAWHTADAATKKVLEKANADMRNNSGAAYNSKTGVTTWGDGSNNSNVTPRKNNGGGGGNSSVNHAGINTVNLEQSIRDELTANSAAWWTADPDERAALEGRNATLRNQASAAGINVNYDPKTGKTAWGNGGEVLQDIDDYEDEGVTQLRDILDQVLNGVSQARTTPMDRVTYDRDEINNILDDATKTKYNALENALNKNETELGDQYYALQQLVMDTTRRNKGTAYANGANAGAHSANELSSLLGLSQDSSAALTAFMQDKQNLSKEKEAEVAANASTALTASNDANFNLQNALNNIYASDKAYGASAVTGLAQLLSSLATGKAAMYGADQSVKGAQLSADAAIKSAKAAIGSSYANGYSSNKANQEVSFSQGLLNAYGKGSQADILNVCAYLGITDPDAINDAQAGKNAQVNAALAQARNQYTAGSADGKNTLPPNYNPNWDGATTGPSAITMPNIN